MLSSLYVNFLSCRYSNWLKCRNTSHIQEFVFEISVLGHRAVEELKIWKREVKQNKKTNKQESIRHFAHLNVPSSLEFISNEHCLSGRISQVLFLTAPPNVCTCIFSSLQLICPLKDIFPLLCFYWVWVFHMISGWVGDWAASFDGWTFLKGRRMTRDLHQPPQEGSLILPGEQTAWCQTPLQSLLARPLHSSACFTVCLVSFYFLSFLSLTQVPLFPIIPNMRNSHTLVEISLWD